MGEKDERYYRAFMTHNEISRRGLLRGLFGGTQKVRHEALAPEVKRLVPRPPHAVEEALFQQLCKGCGECEKACPEQIINIQDGLATLCLDYGYCSQCGECQKVCETRALTDSSSDITLRPQFEKGCQNHISGYCKLCVSQCPHDAITIKSGALPVLTDELCDGCCRCKQACNVSAISMQFPNYDEAVG